MFEVKRYPSKDFVLATAQLQATFSGSTGLLQSVVKGKDEVNVKVDFVTYGARKGRDRSGAYLFLPDREAQGLLSSWSTTPVTITVGPLVREARHRPHSYTDPFFSLSFPPLHSCKRCTRLLD